MFKVGDLVVCLQRGDGLHVGQTYVVDDADKTSVYFEETGWWRISRFELVVSDNLYGNKPDWY